MNQDKYVRPEEACKLLQITTNTLIQWDKAGKIQCVRTKGGHRRYLLSSLHSQLSNPSPLRKRRRIAYCRVSSHSQKEDLERQIEFFRTKYPHLEIIRDIGSGINFKRKGFNSLLDAAIKGDIEEVVVTHRDRLCRFGFELIQRIILEHSKGKVVVLNQTETSPEKELVNDLLSIITVFSSRLYGLRSHSLKRQIQKQATQNLEDEVISNQTRERAVSNDV